METDNDDVNMKFLRALPPSWSQDALTLKTRGGLEYLSFDDLYNKLRSLEIDVKGGSSYGSRGTIVAPTHSTFIGVASTNTKMVYSDQPIHSSSITYTFAHSGSIMEDVLIHLLLKMSQHKNWLMKILNRECNVKKVDEKARYSTFNISEVKIEEPKAMVSVDSMLNWNEHKAENKTEEGEQVYGLMAGFKSNFSDHAGNADGSVYDAAAEFAMMEISPKVQTCPFGCDSKLSELKKNYDHLEKLYNNSFIQVQAYKNTVKTLELQKDWYHKTQLALEEKAKIENKEWEVKLTESLARIHCKNNFVRTKTCFVCGSKSHLIKDCDVYDNMDNIPSVDSKEAYVPSGSRNSSASIFSVRSIPAASRNRPASIHAGRHIPAAKPFFRPTALYVDNVSWPGIYNYMSMNEGIRGFAAKSSAGCSWKYNRPYMKWGSKNNGGSHQSTWFHT
nr:hypothetical protein [Tanacetum cinerariifolium]